MTQLVPFDCNVAHFPVEDDSRVVAAAPPTSGTTLAEAETMLKAALFFTESQRPG